MIIINNNSGGFGSPYFCHRASFNSNRFPLLPNISTWAIFKTTLMVWPIKHWKFKIGNVKTMENDQQTPETKKVHLNYGLYSILLTLWVKIDASPIKQTTWNSDFKKESSKVLNWNKTRHSHCSLIKIWPLACRLLHWLNNFKQILTINFNDFWS